MLNKIKQLFSRPEPPPPAPVDPLDQYLFQWDQFDGFSIRDACEGVQIFGGIGSGKTSGSGETVARAYLRNNFGGLVLTAKPDECQNWKRYAAETGRSQDLIIISPENEHRFNFINYEYTRPGRGSGLTGNLVELLLIAVEASQRSKSKGGQDDSFWKTELKKLMRNAFDLLVMGGSDITIQRAYDVINSAPYDTEDLKNSEWRKESYCADLLAKASTRVQDASDADKQDFNATYDYWVEEFPKMADKTRGTVISTFTGTIDGYLRNPLYNLFCTETNFSPTDTFDGKIIILDLPIKEYNEVGLSAQMLFKYIWQRAIERREISDNSRPVFLWADESQYFVNEFDSTFQTTARSSRACTVLLTQNISNYYAAVGGGSTERAFVDSLIGNLSTKVFHNNNDAKTNEWAAELFAKDWLEKKGSSASFGQGQNNSSISMNQSEEFNYAVPPKSFTGLLKGGPQNNFSVEGIVHQGGKTFQGSGINALRTAFYQTRK